jgi:hypothetical protein
MRLAASQVQFEYDWRPTIGMRLAATRLQDKRQAYKGCVKGHLYIILYYVTHVLKGRGMGG